MMSAFGERIKILRKEHGFTQREFAEALGIDFTYISKIENGRTDFPPSEQLITRMAELLEASNEELLQLAGQFDHRALQRRATETPGVSAILRRLHQRQYTPDDINRILKAMDDSDEATTQQ